MKVTVTPLEKVKSSKEKLNSYPLLESNKKQKDQKSFKLQSTQCGVCEKCNCRNCGQCWNCQNMTKFGGSGWSKQACLEMSKQEDHVKEEN